MQHDERFRDFMDLMRLELKDCADAVATMDEDQAFEVVMLYSEHAATMAADLAHRLGHEEYNYRAAEYFRSRSGAETVN